MKFIDKKVLIKEAPGGSQDKIYAVRGLPENLLFKANGELLPGVEKSQTGDGSFVFFDGSGKSQEQLKLIDQYIASVYPRTKVLPKRLVNAQMIGDSRSPALTAQELESRMTQMYGVPFVDLPVPETVPTFKAPSSADVISDTYKKDGFVSSDPVKAQVAEIVEKVAPLEEPVTEEKWKKPEAEATKYDCPEEKCEYKANNYRAFRMHTMKKHKKVLERGQHAVISSP